MTKIVELAQQIISLAQQGDVTEFPTPEKIAEMELVDLKKLAVAFGITAKLKQAELVTVLSVVSKISSESTEDIELADVQLAQKALGLEPAKKLAKGLESIAAYIEAYKAEEDAPAEDVDGDGEADDDDKEKSEEGDDEKEEEDDDDKDEKEDDDGDGDDDDEGDGEGSSDDDKDEDEDEEEEDPKPAKSKKSAKVKAPKEEDDDEDNDDDDDDDDEEGEEEKEDDDNDDDSEGEDADTQKEHLDAFNKVAKKKLKKYEQLEELLTDNDGNVAEWQEAYVRLDSEGEEEGYCCGMPIEELKVKNDKRQFGKCAVTGKKFVVNSKGKFVAA